MFFVYLIKSLHIIVKTFDSKNNCSKINGVLNNSTHQVAFPNNITTTKLMKIKRASIWRLLAIVPIITTITHAAEVSVEWPTEWEDAPSTVWDCTVNGYYIASYNPKVYYTNSEGKTCIYAQFDIGTGSSVFATEIYNGTKDVSIDGDIWLIMSEGTLANVASAKTVGEANTSSTSYSYNNITTVGGDANYYYTGSVSTSLIMGAGLAWSGTYYLSGEGEHTINIQNINNVEGTARIYVDEDASISGIVGGGYVYQSTSLDTSSGGTFTGTVVAESTAGATEITIAGGTIGGNIFGGGYVAASSITNNESGSIVVSTSASILGNTSITIEAGTVGTGSSVILGGGYINASGIDAEAKVYGDTSIQISGGTINASIYGGGNNNSNVGNADVLGDTTITITGGTINGDVTASGLNYTSTYGDASITISGDATITGSIAGTTPTSTVLGTTTLNLGTAESTYEQTIQSVSNFDLVTVSTGSDVEVAGSLTDVTELQVNGTLTLSESTDVSIITITEDATLNVTATGSSIFSNTNLVWENSGTVNISAAENATVGYTYTIFASDVSITGELTSSDGTISNNTYTVGVAGEDYTAIVLDAGTGTIVENGSTITLNTEGDSTSSVVMQFNVEASVTITSVNTITAESDSSFADIVIETVGTDSLISSAAYEFNLESGLGENDTVLISFYVGIADYDISQFVIYHKSGDDDGVWEEIEASDLSYSDNYLSFTVDGFSSYGYALKTGTIPEPSTATLSLLALAGLMARRRR